jgi:hypothetical protein
MFLTTLEWENFIEQPFRVFYVLNAFYYFTKMYDDDEDVLIMSRDKLRKII